MSLTNRFQIICVLPSDDRSHSRNLFSARIRPLRIRIHARVSHPSVCAQMYTVVYFNPVDYPIIRQPSFATRVSRRICEVARVVQI